MTQTETYSVYVCPSCKSEEISYGDNYINAFTCSDCGCNFAEYEAEEIVITAVVKVPDSMIPPAPSPDESADDIPF